MFVVTERVGAANSEGVLCSGLSSIAKRFIQCVIQRFGTSRSYGAKPHCGGRGLQTLHPYGILCAAQIIFVGKQEYLDLLRRDYAENLT